ncbi:hypothetical protein [Aequorivita viscosa]|uniref:Lipoprotein n=1 Tax=Aequorivita viscosa TaxID=797419 RepID=A0A1M6IWY9_9FLAO|nr:hypothetical protein [Aequorivita viscosa]SDX15014.1 hypothetical protein SAMN05216556_11868 [Aequorivita viscosa]SHJ38947.1 hypothetical protein SAMN04487908_11567 [Aequorivita viscosa]
MWKNILIIAMVCTFISCGSSKKGVNTSKESKEIVLGNESLSYNSLGNGVALISLKLYDNNTFKFDFKSIPQPETDEKAVLISEKGTYTSEGAWKILNFKNPKFSLAAIFDTDFAQGKEFKVLDEENVKINTAKKSLSIWGVVCEK